ALLRPASGREGCAAHIEAHSHSIAVAYDHVGSPLGILQRCGAEVDACGSALERGLEARVVANTSRNLNADVAVLLDHLANDRGVVAATERRVQIDEVNPLGALCHPFAGGVERVAIVSL